jgi:hypothetical protein
MSINYKPILKKLGEFYIGDIREDELKDYYKKWAEKNGIKLTKCFRLIRDTAYNSEGDVIPIVSETDAEIYYYDSFHRWCYLNKSDEGLYFEYCL